jgi:hypothetical protein
MKQKVRLLHENNIIYEGRISDLPFSKNHIIKRSIELFGDDDPCIIHQSFIIKEFVDTLLTKLNESTSHTIKINHQEHTDLLDLDSNKEYLLKLVK